MRFYDIEIIPGGLSLVSGPNRSSRFATNAQPQHWTSHPKGVTSPPNPGALLIEFDLIQAPQHLPGGNSWLRVWGVGLEFAKQAPRFNGAGIAIRGGMGKGLPLANPAQAGLLVTGQVKQCFTNWIGTAMTMDFILAAVESPAQTAAQNANLPLPPANIVINWPANTQLSTAIKSALSIAYPAFAVNVNISPNLVLSHAEHGAYATLTQFAQWINSLSQYIIGGTYSGVMISAQGSVFNVFDTTYKSPLKQIEFNDLVGQPTWIEPLTIQVPMVLRGDLMINQTIKLPTPTLVRTQASSFSQYRDTSAVQGQFMITKLRHVGNSRDPSGQQWTTAAWAVTVPA